MLTWFPAVLSSSKIFPYFHQVITFLYSCITMHLSYTRYALSGKWMRVVCMLYSALTLLNMRAGGGSKFHSQKWDFIFHGEAFSC